VTFWQTDIGKKRKMLKKLTPGVRVLGIFEGDVGRVSHADLDQFQNPNCSKNYTVLPIAKLISKERRSSFLL